MARNGSRHTTSRWRCQILGLAILARAYAKPALTSNYFFPEQLAKAKPPRRYRSTAAPRDPWVLESGTRALLLANFATDRNYFDGKLVLQDGTRRTVPPFYSAAAIDDPNGTTWLLALVDGSIELFHPASGTEEQLTPGTPWGSDLASMSGACASGSQILATRAVEDPQADALQAFSIANRTAHPSAAPLPVEGTIRALWPAGPSSALAVIFDPAAHKYRAYAVSFVCGS
jgi:hypothetical protein